MPQLIISGEAPEFISVKQYGAVGDGVVDDTAAFSAAAQAAVARINIAGAEGTNIPRASMCRVRVPDGTYLITSEIDTSNRTVVWEFDQAATLSDYSYINGRVVRAGQRQNDYHHGTTDYACSYTIRANGDLGDGAEVLGITTEGELSTYSHRDSVAMFINNKGPAALIDVGSATYTATTVTIAAQSATVLKRLRKGMIIDTKHATKWSAFVDSWNEDASVITVNGWYQQGGGGTPSTPTNDGTGCVVNGFTAIWGQNTNVILDGSSYAAKSNGYELGVVNNRGVPVYNGENFMMGYVAANMGTYQGGAGFAVRLGGAAVKFLRGFVCDGATDVGYYLQGTPTYGFWTEQASGIPFRHTIAATTYFQVESNGYITAKALTLDNANAFISLGSTASSNTPNIDFNSSGNVVDFDARLIATGGTGTAGQGTLTCNASSGFVTTGPTLPSADNSVASGSSSKRWSNVYGTNIRPGAGTVTWTSGSGTPEGAVTAVVGSLYTRTDGGASTTLYVKESGTGNTGWIAK